jgi:hypothetical protein
VERRRLVIAAIFKNIDFSQKETLVWKCKLELPLSVVISFKHYRNDWGLLDSSTLAIYIYQPRTDVNTTILITVHCVVVVITYILIDNGVN